MRYICNHQVAPLTICIQQMGAIRPPAVALWPGPKDRFALFSRLYKRMLQYVYTYGPSLQLDVDIQEQEQEGIYYM